MASIALLRNCRIDSISQKPSRRMGYQDREPNDEWYYRLVSIPAAKRNETPPMRAVGRRRRRQWGFRAIRRFHLRERRVIAISLAARDQMAERVMT